MKTSFVQFWVSLDGAVIRVFILLVIFAAAHHLRIETIASPEIITSLRNEQKYDGDMERNENCTPVVASSTNWICSLASSKQKTYIEICKFSVSALFDAIIFSNLTDAIFAFVVATRLVKTKENQAVRCKRNKKSTLFNAFWKEKNT